MHRCWVLTPMVLLVHWAPLLPQAAPVRQPAAWGAWQQFEDQGMLSVIDRGPALIDHDTTASSDARKTTISKWHCVSQLEQPELLLRQHEWDLNVGASVLVANTGCSSRLALLRAGLGRRVREANIRAIEIAQQARQSAHLPDAAARGNGSPRALLVARLGTTLPIAPDGSSFRWPTASEEERSYDEQLEILAHTGAEVLEVGPIGTVAHGNRAITSAARSGLPIWIAVSVAINPPPAAIDSAQASKNVEQPYAFAVPELYQVVLREEPQQTLDEAIRLWIDVARASEGIDSGGKQEPSGPGVGGTNIVGLIIHSSAPEMLPILKSVTAFDSSWPASGFLGAYVDVVLPEGVGYLEGDDQQKHNHHQQQSKAVRNANSKRSEIARRPHSALGSGWQLKDSDGIEAAFVKAA